MGKNGLAKLRDKVPPPLRGYAVRTHQEIGDLLGISRARVQQIERRAIGKLRDGLAGVAAELFGNDEHEQQRQAGDAWLAFQDALQE